MNKKDKDKCRKILLELKEHVQRKIYGDDAFGLHARTEGQDISQSPSHLADIGTDSFDRDMQFNIAANDSELLSMVNNALAKIHDGDYGVCETCHEKINPKRLLAIPFSVNCVPCQEKLEEAAG